MGRWWFHKPGNSVTRLVSEATAVACQNRERLYRGCILGQSVVGPDSLSSTWSLKILTLEPVFRENGGRNYIPRTGGAPMARRGPLCVVNQVHTTRPEGLLQSYDPPSPTLRPECQQGVAFA